MSPRGLFLLATILVSSMAAALGGAAATAQTANWPHEPAGARVITDCSWDSLCSGWLDGYASLLIQPDSGDMLSGPMAKNNRLAPGASEGGSQLDYTFTPTREIFIGTVLRTNDDFVGYSHGGNKVFFIQSEDTGSTVQFFTNLGGDGSTGPRPFLGGSFGYNNQNAGQLSNCHLDHVVGDCPGGVNMYSNVDGSGIERGRYYKLELYLKSSTTDSSADGAIILWVDGVKRLEHLNANMGDAPWYGVSVQHTWDGQAGARCWSLSNPGGRDCSLAWEWHFDHFHVSDVTGMNIPGGSAPAAPSAIAVE